MKWCELNGVDLRCLGPWIAKSNLISRVLNGAVVLPHFADEEH
jgi:hypothetical protein